MLRQRPTAGGTSSNQHGAATAIVVNNADHVLDDCSFSNETNSNDNTLYDHEAHTTTSGRRRKTTASLVGCDLYHEEHNCSYPSTAKANTPIKTTKQMNDSYVLWSLFMSTTEICLVVRENTYNEVVAGLYLILASIGIVLMKLLAYSSSTTARSSSTSPSSHSSRATTTRSRRSVVFVTTIILVIVMTIQISFLFSILVFIAGVHKMNETIDMIAFKFLFTMNKKELQTVLGTSVQDTITYYILFSRPFFIQTIFIAITLAVIVKLICVKTPPSLARRFQVICHKFLVGILIIGSVMLSIYTLPKQKILWKNIRSLPNDHTSSCTGPPPLILKQKPNIIVLTVDAWRKDLVNHITMPNTFTWLKKQTNHQNVTFVEWNNHDAAAVGSDEAYAALYYSKLGMSREELKMIDQHEDKNNIKSWTLEAFRQAGYEMHRVTSYHFDFCWYVMEQCSLYTRDYDYLNGYGSSLVPKMVSSNQSSMIWPHVYPNASQNVYPTIIALLEQQQQQQQEAASHLQHDKAARTSPPPLFISADVQDLHEPYDYVERPNVTYHSPILHWRTMMSILAHTFSLPRNPRRRQNVIQQVKNMYKNCLINLDLDFHQFLNQLQPYLNNTIFVLTGDHGELIFDEEKVEQIFHNVPVPIDVQRQVPLFMIGPIDIVSNLQQIPNKKPMMATTSVTNHADVLLSILEALVGDTLGSRWQDEIPYHSQYNNNNQRDNNSDKDKDDDDDDSSNNKKITRSSPILDDNISKENERTQGFVYASRNDFVLLIQGNKRLVTDRKGNVQEAHYLSNHVPNKNRMGQTLTQADIDDMKQIMKRMDAKTWPGLDSTKWDPQCRQ